MCNGFGRARPYSLIESVAKLFHRLGCRCRLLIDGSHWILSSALWVWANDRAIRSKSRTIIQVFPRFALLEDSMRKCAYWVATVVLGIATSQAASGGPDECREAG